MVQYFEADEALRKQIRVRQRKKMDLGKLKKIIIILWCIALPFLFYYFYMSGGGPSTPVWEMTMEEILTDDDLFIAVTITLACWITPLLFFIVIMDRVMVLNLNKLEEVLAVYEDGIKNLYVPFNRSWDGQAEEVHIYFKEIRKLEWHAYYQMLKVYAPVHYIYYSDYGNRKIARQGELTGEDGFRLFYAYYKPFDQFLSLVEQKSGIPIEKITEKTKFKREVKINGWKTLKWLNPADRSTNS